MRRTRNTQSTHQRPQTGDERGIAIVLVFLVLIVVLGLTLALTSDTVSETTFVESSQNVTKATYGAESGVALAENTLWNGYLNAQGGTPGLMPTYLTWLDGPSGIAWPSRNMANEGVAGTGLNLIGAQSLDGRTNLQNVEVWRNDAVTGSNTTLTFLAQGQDRFQNPTTITARYRVAGGSGGLNFAILARDMSCIFCHAEVDNVGRAFNADPSNYGSYERVRVGSLHSTMLRPSNTDTNIAGTLYTRGHFLDKDNGNAPMSAASFTSSTLDSYDFNSGTGYITQGGGGGMTQEDLINAVPVGGVLPVGENLYMDYPTTQADMTDGYLPEDIAPLFVDSNGNRVVDSAEIQARMSDVSSDYGYRRAGTVSGGVIHTTPLGGSYAGSSLPTTGNTTSIDAVNNGVCQGNVILRGTDANPIVLDNTIVVEGDVVIEGVVQGMGQIYASGNIYIPGDISYPSNHDWGANDNGLMLKAGGNVLVNDFLTPRMLGQSTATATAAVNDPTVMATGDHRTETATHPSFTEKQIQLSNRLEWEKTQPNLPNQWGNPVPNPNYDPTYVPKYTVMGPGDPVYIFGNRYQKSNGAWKGAYYDPAQGVWLGTESAKSYKIAEDKNLNGVLDPGEDVDGDGQLDRGELIMLEQSEVTAAGGAITQLTTNGSWISDQNLKNFWINDHNARTDGQPLTINAGIETDNTIFMLARNKTRFSRKFQGQSVVNGMLVANNIGMLSPGDANVAGADVGLRVNYDGRLQDFDGGDGSNNPVVFTRLSMRYQ